MVIQFNKRDLPDAQTDAEMEEARKRGGEPVVGAVALRGEGVMETLHALLQSAWRNLDARTRLSRNVGLTEKEFLTQIFQQMDLTGTGLEAALIRRWSGREAAMSADKPGRRGERASARRSRCSSARLALVDMLDPPTFTEVVKSFGELYRVGIQVLDERGAKLADVKGGNGDFCGYVYTSARTGARAARRTVARVKEGPLAPARRARRCCSGRVPWGASCSALPCFTGLRYLVMPVLLGGGRAGARRLRALRAGGAGGPAGLAARRSRGWTWRGRASCWRTCAAASEHTVAKVVAHVGAGAGGAAGGAGRSRYLTGQLHLEAMLETQRELEAQNAQLLRLNQRLKEVDRSSRSFLGTVSHELRTPLSSIIGYSEMLAEGLVGGLNAEQMQYVRTIMEKGETLLKLISSILDMSQIEAGKVRLAFESVDVQRAGAELR